MAAKIHYTEDTLVQRTTAGYSEPGRRDPGDAEKGDRMSAGAVVPAATCNESLQVDPEPKWPLADELGTTRSVVKESLITDSGAARRRAVKFGLMVARSLRAAERKTNATELRELEALEKQVKEKGGR